MTVRDTRTEIRGVEALAALLGGPTEAARNKAGHLVHVIDERTIAPAERPENTVAELDEHYGPSYAENIYCTSGA